MAQAKTQFGYRRHPDQDRSGATVAEHPVVVVGAGPVGLSFAIDLAQRGHKVVLLDDADRIGEGLTAVVSVKLDHPEFEGSTRGVLGNAAAQTCVAEAVQEHLARWLDGHPEQALTVVDRIVRLARQD